MEVKEHYEKFWLRNYKNNFESYERNDYIDQFFSENEKVLDLGCGNGEVAYYLTSKKNADVVGLDISQTAIKQAKKLGIKAIVGDQEKRLLFRDRTFDKVFWGDNIEHLFNPEFTLSEINRVLKNGGQLVLSCPNMAYFRYRLYYFLNGELPDTEWSGNPPWYWSHIRFFNRGILTQLLKKHGFKVDQIVGVNRRKVEKYLSKIYPEHFGMILIVAATKSNFKNQK